jgi:hypothetical protein
MLIDSVEDADLPIIHNLSRMKSSTLRESKMTMQAVLQESELAQLR